MEDTNYTEEAVLITNSAHHLEEGPLGGETGKEVGVVPDPDRHFQTETGLGTVWGTPRDLSAV